jgi:YHS domain-containing protein
MLTTRIMAVFLMFGLSGAASLAADPAAGLDAGAARVELLPPVLGVTERQASDGFSGLALDGFDPVTYFLQGTPQAGRVEHEILWGGVAWRFASAANKAAFRSDPQVYAPRLGGHDPEGMLRGQLVDAQPSIFAVRPSGLYVFHDEEARRRFLADESLFDQAESAWAALQTTIVTR